MYIKNKIEEVLPGIIKELFGKEIKSSTVLVQKTRREFEGDFTVVVFPFTKLLNKPPEVIGNQIGEALVKKLDEVDSFNVIKGFLNLTLKVEYWLNFFADHHSDVYFGYSEPLSEKPIVVEFSSPNTNKPLHLGHIRNNLLGDSISRILDANGYGVHRVNLVNDRGIHICKSMLAWLKWGDGATPETTGIKGDRLVGDYYVLFEKEYRRQVSELIEAGKTQEQAEADAKIMIEVRNMLKKWEGGDPEIIKIWRMMNNWVYNGFDITYNKLGISFDKTYYESETYLHGKKIVEEGLDKGVFFRKPDGSIWVDLSKEGLDDKLLLRSDGTSVYITQDLGTAQLRYDDFDPSQMIYVVGNEQNYHFDVLKKVLKKLAKPYCDALYHLSYGMVELPEGKMKSREGTIVDADDLMDLMEKTAEKITAELGKTEGMTENQKLVLYNKVGLGALKYFILKVDPKKNMVFNPNESIDFNGHTAPFILYTYARIHSVLRKAPKEKLLPQKNTIKASKIAVKEKELIKLLHDYPLMVKEAANEQNPSVIANYAYDLAKEFNQFYHEYSILNENDSEIIEFRIRLASFTGIVIRSALDLLGIDVVERM